MENKHIDSEIDKYLLKLKENLMCLLEYMWLSMTNPV